MSPSATPPMCRPPMCRSPPPPTQAPTNLCCLLTGSSPLESRRLNLLLLGLSLLLVRRFLFSPIVRQPNRLWRRQYALPRRSTPHRSGAQLRLQRAVPMRLSVHIGHTDRFDYI
ncbi:hypothetical protein DFH06DRAFT_1485868 [Mycena polygramma]|nr:hypothetical protein DFH06DRAFT_1485868 [Mycena polygramma]